MSTPLLPHSSSRILLRETPFFQGLGEEQRRGVLSLSEVQEHEAGQHVYRLGEQARHFYVLAHGIVRLTIGLDQRNASAGNILHRGQVFGWAALTPNTNRRIATALCITPATVLAIDGPRLLELMDGDHSLGYCLMRQLNLLITGTLTACAAG